MKRNDQTHDAATARRAVAGPYRELRGWIPGTLFVVALLLGACAPPAETPPPTDAAATPADLHLPAGVDDAEAKITAGVLRDAVAALSDDALEGRGPGTAGDAAARRYIAEQLAALGVRPGAADGSWEQPFDIVSVTSTSPENWTFVVGDDAVEKNVPFWDGYIASSGVQDERAVLDDAELVFVGYGIDAPEYDWNDFAGRDLAGKVLVVLNNDPDWDDDLFAGQRRLYYGRWDYKYESAERQGAAGAIILHTDASAGYGWNVIQTSWTGAQFQLPAVEGVTSMPIEAWLTWNAARDLFAAAGHDLDALATAARDRSFEPVDLGIRTSLVLENAVERTQTANVLGLLPGGDLADEVVVYTAHHDHLGRGKAGEDGDDIYNGARDNASGVAQVLAAARAFAALPEPPRRSILFALVAAEEQGLLGSQHYAENPTFPPGKIAAAVNVDAGNIWGRSEDLIFIGYGKSSLDAIADAAAARQDRHVVGDQQPDKGHFYRSDQFSLAKIGVPAFYLDGGEKLRGMDPGEALAMMDEWTATRYHQPNDELTDDWSFDGLVEDTRLAFVCGLAVAQADELPAWKPGDEFEAARLEALAATPPGGQR